MSYYVATAKAPHNLEDPVSGVVRRIEVGDPVTLSDAEHTILGASAENFYQIHATLTDEEYQEQLNFLAGKEKSTVEGLLNLQELDALSQFSEVKPDQLDQLNAPSIEELPFEARASEVIAHLTELAAAPTIDYPQIQLIKERYPQYTSVTKFSDKLLAQKSVNPLTIIEKSEEA